MLPKINILLQTRCSIFCIIGFPKTALCEPRKSVLVFKKKKKKKVYLKIIKSDGKFIFKIPVLSVSLLKDGHVPCTHLPVPPPQSCAEFVGVWFCARGTWDTSKGHHPPPLGCSVWLLAVSVPPRGAASSLGWYSVSPFLYSWLNLFSVSLTFSNY